MTILFTARVYDDAVKFIQHLGRCWVSDISVSRWSKVSDINKVSVYLLLVNIEFLWVIYLSFDLLCPRMHLEPLQVDDEILGMFPESRVFNCTRGFTTILATIFPIYFFCLEECLEAVVHVLVLFLVDW